MGLRMRRYGDWARAGVALRALGENALTPEFEAQLKEDGELLLKTIQGHIDSQDLGWAPLSEHTVVLKGGSSTIYVETGFLRGNIKVRKVRSAANGVSFFIGADAWTTHGPSGEKFSNIMIWLEYGTDKIPPRPLIRPTWEEIKPIVQEHCKELVGKFLADGAAL